MSKIKSLMSIFRNKDEDEDDDIEESLEDIKEEGSEDNSERNSEDEERITEIEREVDELSKKIEEIRDEKNELESTVNKNEEQLEKNSDMIENLSSVYELLTSNLNPVLPDSLKIPKIDNFENNEEKSIDDKFDNIEEEIGEHENVVQIDSKQEGREESSDNDEEKIEEEMQNFLDNEKDADEEENHHDEDIDKGENIDSFSDLPIDEIDPDDFRSNYIMIKMCYFIENKANKRILFRLLEKYMNMGYITQDFYDQISRNLSSFLLDFESKYPELVIYSSKWSLSDSKKGKYKVIIDKDTTPDSYEYFDDIQYVSKRLDQVYSDDINEYKIDPSLEEEIISYLILISRNKR